MIEKEQHMLMYMKKYLGWDKDKLPYKTIVKVYPRGHYLLRAGEMETNFHFLVSGIVESTLVAKNGEEKIMDFFFLNSFFCSMSSIISKKPTQFNIRCLTECTIETVTNKDYGDALKKSITLNIISRKLLEDFYLYRVKKERDMLTKTASERYLDLIKDRQDIIKDVPLEKIAKYLGIHPRSLSRIRRSVYK